MYIWMILAVFVTTLFAFNLHVRPDAKSLYSDSQASTTVAKVTIWHDAMRDGLKKAYDSATDEDHPSNDGRFYIGLEVEPVDDPSGPHKQALESINSHMRIPLADKLPGTKSKIYCVNETYKKDEQFFERNNDDGTRVCDGGQDIACCFGTGNYQTKDDNGYAIDHNGEAEPGLYLVTIAPIPVKWQSRNEKGVPTKMPNNELVHGIHYLSARFYNRTDRLGYMEPGEYSIKSFGKDPFEIPAAIISKDSAFFNDCQNTSCIIYMSKVNIKTANTNENNDENNETNATE